MIKKKFLKHQDLIPIYGILLIMVIIMAIYQSNFFSVPNFLLLARQLSPYIFIAMSQAIIMIIGGMDFSVGAMVSLSTCIFATHLNNAAFNIPSILIILIICGTIGGLTGWLISWFKLPSIVVTLATSFVLTGFALVFLPVPGGSFPVGISSVLIGNLGFIPAPLIIMAIFVAIWTFIKKSSVGLLIYAVGNNKEAARTSGLSVNKAYIIAYFLSSVMSAMAGLMLCAITLSGDPTIGVPMTINSVTAAVLGGVSFAGGEGKIAGAIVGAAVVGMLVNVLFYLNITGFYTYVVQGIILILAVAANSRKRGGAAI